MTPAGPRKRNSEAYNRLSAGSEDFDSSAAAFEASLLFTSLKGTSYQPAADAALHTLLTTLRNLKQEHDQR